MSETGSAWLNWSSNMMIEYKSILHKALSTLNRLPRWPFTITDSDIDKLIQISMALGIDISDYNLSNRTDYNILVGECKKIIIEFLHSDLRPSDPVLEKLEKLKKIDKNEIDDLMEVGEGEL